MATYGGLTPEQMLENYLKYGYSGATSWQGWNQENPPTQQQIEQDILRNTGKTAAQLAAESGKTPEQIVENYARTGSTGVVPGAPSAPVDIEMWLRQNWQLVAIVVVLLLILRR